jgi:flavin reductase (DIM6/NTAB) family NADH-FMN oxidoreductase RutF
MSESLVALMRSLTLGVYVIGVCDGQKPNAFTACSVMPVSFEPVLLTVAIGRDHASLSMLRASGQFTVNVLKRDQLALARHFGLCSGRDEDKLAQVAWRPGPTGAPLLNDALACLACEVQSSTGAGDHELIVARVMSGTLQDAQASPMTYADTGNMDGSADLYAQRRIADAPGSA